MSMNEIESEERRALTKVARYLFLASRLTYYIDFVLNLVDIINAW